MGMSSWASSASSRAGQLPWLLVVLGPALLFGPALVSGQVLYWGATALQFVPWHTFAVQSVIAGEIPLWNPLVGMGAPLLANYQSGLLYPPNWTMLFLEPAVAQTWLTMLHLILAGAGMILLCRRLGVGAIGQCVAGLGYALSGYLVARSSFQSINNTVAWLPWLIWAAEGLVVRLKDDRGVDAAGRASLILAVLLAAQWLGGHAQTAWYSLLLVVAWLVWRGGDIWRKRRGAEMAVWIGAGLGLAFCIAAAQLIPTAEYLALSSRSEAVDLEAGLTYSLWPWRLLGWLVPGLFGHPAIGGFWGYANYWEDALYVGTLAFVLALFEAVRALRGSSPTKALSRFLIGVFLVSLVLALGNNTPLYPLLFKHIPSFDMFQAPTRWSLLAVFAVCLLGGLGADGWRAPQGRALYWIRLGTAGAAGMIAVAFLGARLLPGLESSFIRSVVTAGFALSTVGALTLSLPSRPRPLWLAALGLFLLADLLLATVGLNPTTPADGYRGKSELATLGSAHRLYMPAELEKDLKFDSFFRFDRFDSEFQMEELRASGLPNITLLDGLSSANNFDPLVAGRYAAWIAQLELGRPESQRRMFSLMDVAWVATRGDAPTTAVYLAIDGAARARLVPRAVWVCSSEEALERVSSGGYDTDSTVILEAEDCGREEGNGPLGSVEIVAEGPNSVTLAAESEAGGWVVLSDLFYPGWHASIDGETGEILPADGLFRAVQVPPGAHTIQMEYRPSWLPWSAGLSFGGVMALLILVWQWRER